MSDTHTNDTTEVTEKPVQEAENVFPPFPEPTDGDFEDDISEEERAYYKKKFQDLNTVTTVKLHCSACDRHLSCSGRNESKMRTHPMLRTLMCHTCYTFYNSGEFDKGDDGSELYCRWCGQGGQVFCCADCPHVFCAKCIKRNLGFPKIKEIEQLDDWKCFKCNPRCLWDLRAICWAVLRYCDLKNRNKTKRKEKIEAKKKEADQISKKSTATIISKIPPTIQVKKFASINAEDIKNEMRISLPQKRPASPRNKPIIIKNPVTLTTTTKAFGLTLQPAPKRMKVPIAPAASPIRFSNDKKGRPVFGTYTRTPRPKPPVIPMIYNGFTNNTNNTFNLNTDNINLSIESLTQGLDMSAVAAMASSTVQDDDVVCTPDFPMEPLCEVSEDNPDDDVQCITPAPVVPSKGPPPLVSRTLGNLPDLSAENIIQMTDNDVTVNASTGGLKFRVDPQTLSSNKMYRLPDGRIFAINVNPTMPGGYSATIVAVTDNSSSKLPQKGATYAAKLSAVSTQVSTPPLLKTLTRSYSRSKKSKRHSTPKSSKTKSRPETRVTRICDLNVPVEWFRYNLIDAIDALEYSLTRLNQLKKETSSTFLRSRTVNEMRSVTRTLENLLNTSSTRFTEIKENLNKDLKQYMSKKETDNTNESDDDDVEILPDIDNDDPIFIDENSVESNSNEGPDVDLTALGSEHDSNEKSIDKADNLGPTDTIHVIKDDETTKKKDIPKGDKRNEIFVEEKLNQNNSNNRLMGTNDGIIIHDAKKENGNLVVQVRLEDDVIKEWADDIIVRAVKNEAKDNEANDHDDEQDENDSQRDRNANDESEKDDNAKDNGAKDDDIEPDSRKDFDTKDDIDMEHEICDTSDVYTNNPKVTHNADKKDKDVDNMSIDDRTNEDIGLQDEAKLKLQDSKMYNETIEELLKDDNEINFCEKSSENKDS